MRLHGDELAPNQVVMLDDKPIMADVLEVDTDEGWVEIALPVLESQNRIDRGLEGEEPTVDEVGIPLFHYETKRLTGEVRIMELKPPKE
jgi:hypothetical protein